MITVVCPNPAVDKICYINKFKAGSKNRIKRVIKSAGGKGINVSRVVSKLNEKVCVLGFKAGYNGMWIDSEIASEGALSLLIEVDGNTRENLNIIDENSETEVLETGPIIDVEKINIFHDVFDEALDKTKILICSGSLPQGLDNGFYNTLVDKARKKNIKTIVDTSGKTLEESLKSKPYMIKPNLEELSYISGSDKELVELDDIIDNAKKVIKNGIEVVIVSMGKNGAVLVTETENIICETRMICKKNSIGCGDSLVAGFSVGQLNSKSLSESLQLGIACAMSNLQNDHIGFIDKEKVNALYETITINEFNKK